MTYGPVGPFKTWLDRLLESAIMITAVALLLNWAWMLIKPMIPIIVVIMGMVIILIMIMRRHYGGW